MAPNGVVMQTPWRGEGGGGRHGFYGCRGGGGEIGDRQRLYVILHAYISNALIFSGFDFFSENIGHFWESRHYHPSNERLFTGPVNCFHRIYSEFGISRGLYRGGGVTYFRDILGYRDG